MFMRVKTIKEFEETCLKIDGGYTIDETDFFMFPSENKFYNDLIGKEIEVQKEGSYTRQGIKYQLYKIKNGFSVPYWFFSGHKERSLKIE